MNTPKITAEVLAKFCAKDCKEVALNSPILADEYILACNLEIAIRCLEDSIHGGIKKNHNQRMAKKIWAIIEREKSKNNPFFPLPDFEASVQPPGGDYAASFTRIKVGEGVDLSLRYLRLIASLPNVKLSPDGENPCYFKFDGGDGVIEPLRQPLHEEIQKDSSIPKKEPNTEKVLEAIKNYPGSKRRDLIKMLPDVGESVDQALWFLEKVGKIHSVPVYVPSIQEGKPKRVKTYYAIQNAVGNDPLSLFVLHVVSHSLDLVEHELSVIEAGAL